MEPAYIAHHKLFEFFTKTYSPSDNLKHEEFIKEIRQTFHDFMEECRNNIDYNNREKNNIYFSDIRLKYVSIKHSYFSNENDISFVYIPLGNEYLKNSDKNYDNILSTLLTFLNLVINHLNGLVKRFPEELSDSNIKDKTEYPSFIARIDDVNLKDAYGQLIKFGFISEKTSPDSFRRVFRGKLPTEKIAWMRGPGLLQYFIISINGKGVEKIRSKWQTTLKCFKDGNTDSDFIVDQLQHGHDPKKIKEIDLVIQTFNDKISD